MSLQTEKFLPHFSFASLPSHVTTERSPVKVSNHEERAQIFQSISWISLNTEQTNADGNQQAAVLHNTYQDFCRHSCSWPGGSHLLCHCTQTLLCGAWADGSAPDRCSLTDIIKRKKTINFLIDSDVIETTFKRTFKE